MKFEKELQPLLRNKIILEILAGNQALPPLKHELCKMLLSPSLYTQEKLWKAENFELYPEMQPILQKNNFGNFVRKSGPSPLKTQISQNPFIFLIIHQIASQKLKIMKFDQEMRPLLRKN